GEKREVAFGAADITSQNHEVPPTRFKTVQLRITANQGVYHLRPSRSSKASDSRGPQLPEGYRGTLAVLAALQTSRMGSTRDQAASTLSPRSKTVAAPRPPAVTRGT